MQHVPADVFFQDGSHDPMPEMRIARTGSGEAFATYVAVRSSHAPWFLLVVHCSAHGSKVRIDPASRVSAQAAHAKAEPDAHNLKCTQGHLHGAVTYFGGALCVHFGGVWVQRTEAG